MAIGPPSLMTDLSMFSRVNNVLFDYNDSPIFIVLILKSCVSGICSRRFVDTFMVNFITFSG